MRKIKDISKIWDAWDLSEGKFIGQYKPHGRVTVEPDWQLNLTDETIGNSNRGPFRWYQRCDNSQIEVEIPNILSIDLDRSIDSDASSCTIRLANQKMYDFDLSTPDSSRELDTQLGRPGYFWFERGKTEDAQARWGQITNEWEDILVPNALIRTYQGYGGQDLSLEDAVDQGYLTLSGVWLVDNLTAGTDGFLSLKCRDMAKLLIDQQLFTPLIPSKLYPLKYCRWEYENVPAGFSTRPPVTTNVTQKGLVPLTYNWSSADAWYGLNASIHGHRGTDSLDGNPETFALSVGNSHPSRGFCTDFFEYNAGENEVNQVFIHPWGGNYITYISIMEGGAWQTADGQLIPHDPTGLSVDSGAKIPYVMVLGIPWEQGTWITLPRTYRAQKIRISFKGHTQSEWGPWKYRCGIREVLAQIDQTTTKTEPAYHAGVPWCFGMGHMPLDGYIVIDDAGYDYAFGDARKRTKNSSNGYSSWAEGVDTTPDGLGYYVLERNGRVHTYGTAVHLGDISDTGIADAVDIAVKPDLSGYWIIRKNGSLFPFGSALDGGDISPTSAVYDMFDASVDENWAKLVTARSIASTSTGDGYWVVNGAGEVFAFGDAVHLGETDRNNLDGPLDFCHGFTKNTDDSGYWLIHASGRVFAFGDAQHFGDLNPIGGGAKEPWGGDNSQLLSVFQKLSWDIVSTSSDQGYWILQGNGMITPFGDAVNFGGPLAGGQLRSNGNYKDYSDIIKELLLWSGWFCYEADPPGSQPPTVYGNIEETGAYADSCIGADVFDKRPPIDAITTIKEIVGYLFWVDDEGAARFQSPNWWRAGNFFDDGSYTQFIPEIDESNQLTSYSINYNDTALRSEIIISNRAPDAQNSDVTTTRYIPETASQLRGIVKPAMWANDVFNNKDEQQIMAELIAVHIWFSQRIGQVSCYANPCIQPDDQIRIYERNTSESYIHYVRGVQTKMDLVTGEYTMTLDTHWLGDQIDWVITADSVAYPRRQITISEELQNFLSKVKSGSTDGLEFGRIIEHTSKTSEEVIPDEEPGGVGPE